MSAPPAVAIRALATTSPDPQDLALRPLAGEAGLDRLVRSPHLQKTGLALAGFHEYLRAGRILILGESEVHFLASRTAADRLAVAGRLATADLPAIVVTAGLVPAPELLAACDRSGLPILGTETPTGTAMARLGARLDLLLAERMLVHGVLVDLLGLGVLILGESGIGKSECALELVGRGHRLIADDVVELRRRAESYVEGTGPEATRFFMEVRGLGLIDVQAIYGVSAVCPTKTVGLVVQLERWDPGQQHERLGLDDQWHELAGVRVPLVRMPVAPGRSVATLVEVAARNEMLKAQGYHGARVLAARLDAARPAGEPL
jgi:HPr kinase/phosphorylase